MTNSESLFRNDGVQKEVAQRFKGLKEKNCHLRILYQPKISSENEGEIKMLSDKGKLG